MKYQPSVDGLRAVAVLAVLCFHSSIAGFSGGYVGVDIFFVISGYLIAGILRDDLQAGRFSLWRFYERRIRRIFPALFCLLAVMFVAGWFILLPSELATLGRNAAATAMFVSNIAYWKTSGYFHRDSASNPLLHTWSLSVEEQFYLLVPILLYGAYRFFPGRIVPLLWALFTGSFLASVWLTETSPSFAFFMAPTRIWEFLAGALLAWNAVRPFERRVTREGAAWGGVALLAWSIVAFNENTRFPGLGALPPVLGTALVIHAGGGTSAARLLALRPIVFLGLISYSLYLWHWPVLIYLRYLNGHDGSTASPLAVLPLSLGLAILSWWFVERPFRSQSTWRRPAIFVAGTSALACTVAAGMVVHAERGWPARFPDAVAVAAAAAADYSPMRARCHSSDENPIPAERACIYGSAVPPTLAIWGDSHAVELAFALGELAERHGRSIAHLSFSACPPAIGFDGRVARGCRTFNQAALRYLRNMPGIRTVFLAARYNAEAYVGTNLAAGMREAVADLQAAGKNVVLVSPIPTAQMDVPRLLAHKLLAVGNIEQVKISRARFDADNRDVFSYLSVLKSTYGISDVRPDEALCDQTSCGLSRNGKALYFDDIHPSLTGARIIAPLFARYFN